jgi:hypothetical protein
MKSLCVRWLALSFLLLSLLEISAYAGSINLGAAGSYGVLAGSTVTNTGSSVISGNLGVWPGSAVTGFPPGIVVGGTIHAGDAAAQGAQSALTSAYNVAAGLAPTANLTGQTWRADPHVRCIFFVQFGPTDGDADAQHPG